MRGPLFHLAVRFVVEVMMSNPLARYQAATGSMAAAMLLFQIAYWMPKATVRHGGHLWIAKAAAEWCAEAGLTMSQYLRAIALLRRLCLVVTEQHIFGGRAITHLRLTAKGLALVKGEKPGVLHG
jgi:hypothetical protein